MYLYVQVRFAERLEKIEARRSNLIDMAADATITREDLRTKLAALDDERKAVREELHSATDAQEALSRLLSWRGAMVEAARGFFDSLTSHGPEERRAMYLKMGLRVEVDGEGNATLKFTIAPGEAFVGRESGQPSTCRRWSPPSR